MTTEIEKLDLPWDSHDYHIYFAEVAGGFAIGACPEPEAKAAFIVQACNSHYELVEALEGLLAYFQSGNSIPVERATIKADCREVVEARAALAKAKRGES